MTTPDAPSLKHPVLDYSGQPFGLGKPPLGRRFLSSLIKASALPVLFGQDSVSSSSMSRGLAVYCGYDHGTFTNFGSVVADHPGARYVAITPYVAAADCLDVEPGDATPSECPAFVRGFRPTHTAKPVIYTSGSDLQAVINSLSAAGIARSEYFLWSAHWIGEHICGRGTCGFPDSDATQYASNNAFDSDVFYSYVFGPVAPPVPPKRIPDGLSDSASYRGVNLGWHAVTGARSYDVQLLSGGVQKGRANVTAPHTAMAVEPSTEYEWRVAAIPGDGWSPLAKFRTPAAPTPPPPAPHAFQAPKNFKAGLLHLDLAWDVVPVLDGKAPTGYTVDVFLAGKSIGTKTTSTNSTTVVLAAGKTYDIEVWANGGKDAPPHSTIHVTV